MEGLGGAFRTGEKPEWGCFWLLWVGLGGVWMRVGLSDAATAVAADRGKRDGCEWRRFMGAVFWRWRLGRVVVVVLGTLKGSGRLEGWRVGEGSSGRVSSSSSRMMEERGEEEDWVAKRCFCVADANMFLLL